eukprot:571907-Ditylum_brightwellii.AAC.1
MKTPGQFWQQNLCDRINNFWSYFRICSHHIWKALQQAHDGKLSSSLSSDENKSSDVKSVEGIEDAIDHNLFFRQNDVDPEEERKKDEGFINKIKQKYNLEDGDNQIIALYSDDNDMGSGSSGDGEYNGDESSPLSSGENMNSDDESLSYNQNAAVTKKKQQIIINASDSDDESKPVLIDDNELPSLSLVMIMEMTILSKPKRDNKSLLLTVMAMMRGGKNQ